MNNQELSGKYFVRRKTTDSWEDVTTKWAGVKILTLDGMNEMGDAQNVFTQKWVDSQVEDIMITKQNNLGQDVIVRANVDLQMTFIVSRRYTNVTMDEQTVYDGVVEWFCSHGDFYIKSAYTNKEAHVVCLKGFKPTTQNLNRGEKSYILATIELHTLDAPKRIAQ